MVSLNTHCCRHFYLEAFALFIMMSMCKGWGPKYIGRLPNFLKRFLVLRRSCKSV